LKIYIVGPVAGGKTTLAHRLSSLTAVPCFSLDNLVYEKDASFPSGNRKNPPEKRNKLFHNILMQNSYIIEDTGRPCFAEGMSAADTLLLLEPPLFVRQKRILFRWIKQNLGLEPCSYRPSLSMLKAMFRWSKDYESGADNLRERISPFSNKLIILRNSKEIERYLSSFPSRTSLHTL